MLPVCRDMRSYNPIRRLFGDVVCNNALGLILPMLLKDATMVCPDLTAQWCSVRVEARFHNNLLPELEAGNELYDLQMTRSKMIAEYILEHYKMTHKHCVIIKKVLKDCTRRCLRWIRYGKGNIGLPEVVIDLILSYYKTPRIDNHKLYYTRMREGILEFNVATQYNAPLSLHA